MKILFMYNIPYLNNFIFCFLNSILDVNLLNTLLFLTSIVIVVLGHVSYSKK